MPITPPVTPLRRLGWDPIPGLAGIVLCGGESRRMGRPKASLPIGDETLLGRIVGRVKQAAKPVVVVASPGQELPELPSDVEVTRDGTAGRGPLQGMLAGLDHVGSRAAAVFIASTDLPFLDAVLIRRLTVLCARGGYDIVVPRLDGRFHPLCAVYSTRIRDDVAALLAEDRLRPFYLFERVRTLAAEADLLLAEPLLALADPALDSVRNVNTPEEYARALADLGFEAPAERR